MPVTFVIDIGNPVCQFEYDKFTTYFNIVDKGKKKMDVNADEAEKKKRRDAVNKQLISHLNLAEKRRNFKNISLRDSMFDGQNIWLLKPSDYNRGRGVHLFNSID